MNDSSWINHPAMKNVDARKLAILVELMNEAEGKPVEKSIPLLMNANKKLKEQNLAFNKDESDLITEILTKNMTPADKAKLEMLKKMMPKNKK